MFLYLTYKRDPRKKFLIDITGMILEPESFGSSIWLPRPATEEPNILVAEVIERIDDIRRLVQFPVKTT